MRHRGAVAFTVALLAVGLALLPAGRGEALDRYENYTGGQYELATGDTTALYPCYSRGGGALRLGVDYTGANGCSRCFEGYVYVSGADIQVQFWGSSRIDTASFTLPDGSTFTGIPSVDSVKVRTVGAGTAVIRWGFWR